MLGREGIASWNWLILYLATVAFLQMKDSLTKSNTKNVHQFLGHSLIFQDLVSVPGSGEQTWKTEADLRLQNQ